MRLVTSLILVLCNSYCWSQLESGKLEYEIPVMQQKQPSYVEYLNDSLKTEPLFYTKHVELKDGKVNIYQRYSILGQVIIPIAPVSDKNQLIPVMSVVSFIPKENKVTQTIEPIHLHDIWKSGPLDYTTSQLKPIRLELGSNIKDKRLTELKALFPLAFTPFDNRKDSLIKYTASDKSDSEYELTTSKKIVEKYTLPEMRPSIKSMDSVYAVNTNSIFERFFSHNSYVFNTNKTTWISLHGEDPRSKDNKLTKYRRLHFISTTEKGAIINDTKIDFDFTRHATHCQYIPDVKYPTTGKTLYVFERQSSLFGNSQLNDPLKNRYQLVVLNDDGSLDYIHTFNTPEGHSFIPLFAYLNEGRVFLVSRTDQDLMMLTATKTGVQILQDVFPNATGKPSARINHNWEYYDYKIVNGQLYFWGEQRKMVQAASSSPQSGVKIPEILNYINFSVVQIDLTQNLIVRQYGFDRSEGDLTIKTHVEDVLTINKKIVFYTSHTKRIKDKQEVENSNRLNFYSNNQFKKSAFDFNSVTRPILYTIDPVSKGATSYKVHDTGFANLYPRNSYLHDDKTLYLVGFDDNRKQDELAYKVIVIDF